MEYEKIDIGSNILDKNIHAYYKIDNGLVDKDGILYIFDRPLFGTKNITTHELLAEYLKLRYFLRIAYFYHNNQGTICPDTIDTSKYPLKLFLLNEKMSIALYYLINNKYDSKLSTFEEKLAKYGSDFGYISTDYKQVPQIFDRKMFNDNIKVLSYTLGNKFDKHFFIDILNK